MSFPDRLFVVTVGTTALAAAHLGALNDKGNPGELRERAKEFLNGNDPDPKLYDDVVKAHRDLWAGTWPPIWPERYSTSAEMVSSYYLLRVQAADTLAANGKAPVLFRAGRDRIVLLSSSTPQGEFSARINARLMHDHLFEEPCDCGSLFTQDSVQCKQTCVLIKVLQGLEATETGFKDIPVHLEEIWQCHAGPKTRVLVNITGGYKGIIPALTYRCFRTEHPEQQASLYYMHENMKGAASIHVRGGRIEYEEEGNIEFVR